MAYDEELAERIRQLVGSNRELTEKKMFGGLAFLIRSNMAIAASSEGGAMVRVDPAQSDALVATTKATPMNMRGREMPGWLRVSSDDLRTDDQLAPWVEIGTGTRVRCRPSRSLLERCLQLSDPAAVIILMRRHPMRLSCQAALACAVGLAAGKAVCSL
jgi:TfoX/Sxy family transcriptional regulator of competence genes